MRFCLVRDEAEDGKEGASCLIEFLWIVRMLVLVKAAEGGAALV
jgi:hypothetical protein